MAETIRGINVKISGDTTGLQAALKDVNKQGRDISSELRSVNRLLKFNPESTELLAQKQKLLGDQVSNTREKLDRLKTAQSQVNKQFEAGEISEGQYRAFQREIVKTSSQLEHFESKLESAGNKSDSFARKINAAGSKLKGVGDKISGVGQKLSGITAAVGGAFAGLTVGTRDFRKEISVLENNTSSAGENMDNMSEAMKQMQGVTGELDSNVEGLSNLLAAGFKGDKFQQVLDELSGAAIKFKDTMKFEGIADGLQETLATGQAVGPFAELLERSGVGLDGFNDGLQEAIKNGEQQNYILNTLADTGLANTYEQYKKNNSELVNSAEAQYSLQEALAKLGEKLEPVMTKLTLLATKVVDKFNNLSPATQEIIAVMVGLAAAIGPVLTVVGKAITIFGKLAPTLTKVIGIATKLGPIIAGLISGPAAPFILAAAAITAAIAIWKKFGDEIKAFLEGAWEGFKNAISSFVQWIPKRMGEIKDNFLETFEKVKDFLKSFSLYNIGKDIIRGLIDGIKSMMKKPVDMIKNMAGNISQSIKDKLGIESPSKVFKGIGQNMTEGLIVGLSDTERNLQMKVDTMVNGMIPQPAAAGAGTGTGSSTKTINVTANYHVNSESTAKAANNDLLSKLQGRGVRGSFR